LSRIDLSFGKLGRQTAIYGAAFVLGRAASFVMLPVYTRFLTPADYGVLQLLQMTVEVAAIVLAAGINNGVLRFYIKAHSPEEKGRVVASALYLLGLFNLLTAAALWLASPLIAAKLLDGESSVRLVHIAAGSVVFETGTIISLLYVQARQQAVLFLVASSSRLVLQVGLNVLFLVYLERGVEGVLLSTLITNALMGTLLTAWMLGQTGVRGSVASFRDLLRFGLPYRVTQMGTFVLTFGDRYFLKAYHSLAVIGIYSLAYQFGFMLMYVATMPFLQAWNPQRFELAKQPREDRDRMYNRGLLYLNLVLISAAAGIALFVGPVLGVMSDPSYHGAARLVPIVLAAYVMQSWTDVAELGIQVSEKTHYATYATWLSVLAILALYLWLIPPLGGMGAALATLASFTLRFFAFYWWSQKLWPVSYRWGPSLGLVAYAVLAVAAGQLWSPETLPAQLGWAAALFLAYAGLAWFAGPLDRAERAEIWIQLARLRGARA